MQCINFAAIKHERQRRNDAEQTPYINHPIGNRLIDNIDIRFNSICICKLRSIIISGVAYILTNEGKVTDLNVILAALLHDTVEDTDTSFEEIRQVFGDAVMEIVAEVTDDKSLPKQRRKDLQVSY